MIVNCIRDIKYIIWYELNESNEQFFWITMSNDYLILKTNIDTNILYFNKINKIYLIFRIKKWNKIKWNKANEKSYNKNFQDYCYLLEYSKSYINNITYIKSLFSIMS